MRHLRWQILIALGGVLLVVGLLLNQTPPQQSTTPQPVSGGALVEGLVGQPVRLNPLLDFNNQVDEDVDRLIYRGLARFDSRGNPIPDLAERWAISADAKFVTVTLRQDAFWHDGEAVEAADVVFTFSKLKEEGFPGPADLQAFWAEINIVLLDDLTVQFQLPEPYAPFLDFLSIGLLPDHLLRGVDATALADHPFNLEPVGTGPFRFERFLLDGERIVGVSLVRNDDFYGQEPFLDRVEFRYFESEADAVGAYQEGEIDSIGQVSLDGLDFALAEPGLNLHTARLPVAEIVYFNLANSSKPFLADKAFRQAMLYGLNRQAIVDQLLAGQAIVASGPILPGTWAASESLQPAKFDPIHASALLDGAGWEIPAGAQPGDESYVRIREEETLALDLLFPEDPLSAQIAAMIASYWRDIGVGVTLRPAEPDEVLEALETRDYDAALTQLLLTRWPDPDPYPLWHDSQAETGQNYAAFDDRNTGIWLERARTTSDRSRRAELYVSFQHRFQDQVPAIILHHPVYNYAISAEIQGVSLGPIFDPSDRFATIETWFRLARRAAGPVSTPVPEETPAP